MAICHVGDHAETRACFFASVLIFAVTPDSAGFTLPMSAP
jgi:hypothetical protein